MVGTFVPKMDLFGEPALGSGKDCLVKILVIENEARAAQSLARALAAEGHLVALAADGNDGLWRAANEPFDAIVLDLILPKRSGFSVCTELRKAEVWTPILVLTAKDGEYDIAEALDAGADDYVTKPFSMVVVNARLRAIARRSPRERPAVLCVDDLTLDLAGRRCHRGGTEIPLTRKEFAILELLLKNKGHVTTKTEIFAQAWDFAHDGDSNVVEVFVSRLRRKIDTTFGTRNLRTIWGVGYELGEQPLAMGSGQRAVQAV
jgi:DNA-binding response OmpR family regulator